MLDPAETSRKWQSFALNCTTFVYTGGLIREAAQTLDELSMLRGRHSTMLLLTYVPVERAQSGCLSCQVLYTNLA